MKKPKPKKQCSAIVLLIAFLINTGQASWADSFEPSSTPEETRQQHRNLPTEDIWWTEYGPNMLWNFKNLHQIFPTAQVYRNGPVKQLTRNANSSIGNFEVQTPKGKLPFSEFIKSEHSTTMGVVILHKGEIAFESYPRMQDYEKPIYWSVAKAIVGTLVRILEERDLVDVTKPIESYLPELKDSVLAGTPVRHILDMANGLDCADDYDNKESCYYKYSVTIGDGYSADKPTQNPYEFVASMKAERQTEPGRIYSYSGVNTFVLAWLVEEVTGMSFQDALTKEIWWRIGAESDAAYIAPVQGIPMTHGGFLSKIRDLARFGLLFTPSQSKVTTEPIISQEHVDFLLTQGNPELIKNAGLDYLINSGVKYNLYQWDAIHRNGTLYKGGWAGQGLIINPSWDVVAVFTSYYKDDAQSEIPLTPVMFQLLNTVYGSSKE